MEQTQKEKIIKEIYDEHYLELYLFLSRYTRIIQDIEDVIQNVFLKLLTSAEALYSIKNMRSYIFLMGKNLMLNLLRDRNRIKEKEIPLEWITSEGQTSGGHNSLHNEILKGGCTENELEELMTEVNKAIQNLPPQCREIFLMAKREGKKYKEISEILSISTKTVENQMGIAFRRIRESVNSGRKECVDTKILSLVIILCLAQFLP